MIKNFSALTPSKVIVLENLADIVPELAALKGIQQPVEYHSEGDAFTHTCLAVKSLPQDIDERVQWAVLLHDIGKATTTKFVDGRWRSHGHDIAGAKIIPQILHRLGKQSISEDVCWLVRHHHFALSWGLGTSGQLTAKHHRFCAQPLFPLLVEVVRADAAGSQGTSEKGKIVEHILEQLQHTK